MTTSRQRTPRDHRGQERPGKITAVNSLSGMLFQLYRRESLDNTWSQKFRVGDLQNFVLPSSRSASTSSSGSTQHRLRRCIQTLDSSGHRAFVHLSVEFRPNCRAHATVPVVEEQPGQ